MRRDLRKALATGARGAALSALLLACAAQAQNSGSVSGYKLPPKGSSAPEPAAGPVDSEHPIATPTTPQAEPGTGSSATPAPAPRITVPAPVLQPERSEPQRPVERPQAQQAERATPSAETPPATPAPAPTLPATDTAIEAPLAVPSPQAEVPAAPQPGAGPNWLLLLAAALAVLLVSGAAILWLRRRSAAPAEEEVVAEEEAEPAVPASAPAALAPIGQALPRPAPQPVATAGPLEFRLEPKSLRLSVVFATLSYRLELANRSETAITALSVAGDITSGHASLPAWEQLSPATARLERKHEIARLAPGESIAFDGELRLPLSEVRPLRAGAAMLFAPLARLLVEAQREDGAPLNALHIFMLGLPSERRVDTMQPFRLDLGPQLFRQIQHREIDTSRWLQLDETRRAG